MDIPWKPGIVVWGIVPTVVAVAFDPVGLTVVADLADPVEGDPLDDTDEGATDVAVPDAEGAAVVGLAEPAVVGSATLVDVVALSDTAFDGPEDVSFFAPPPHAAAATATTAAAAYTERRFPPAIPAPFNGPCEIEARSSSVGGEGRGPNRRTVTTP
jgi:hypothetical protein